MYFYVAEYGVSGQAAQPDSASLTEGKYGCVRSESGWVTFQMNDQNNLPCRPSEGALN